MTRVTGNLHAAERALHSALEAYTVGQDVSEDDAWLIERLRAYLDRLEGPRAPSFSDACADLYEEVG